MQIGEAMLNEVLAIELVSVLRYRRYYFMTHALLGGSVKRAFLAYAKTHQEHADRVAQRIVQIGGAPHLDPCDLAVRSHSTYTAGKTLHDMVGEDLLFVRLAVEWYNELMSYLNSQDRTSARMLDWILAGQTEQAEELTRLFNSLPSVSPT